MFPKKIDNDMKEELAKLSEKLDCFGIPAINVNVDVLQQLITTVNRLINLHRKTLTNSRENNIQYSQLDNELKLKRKKIEALTEKIHYMEKEIKEYANNSSKVQSEMDSLKSRLKERDQDIRRARLYNENKFLEWSHKEARLQAEIDRLKGEPREKSGGQDEKLVKIIAHYKHKEGIFQDTIHKLQESNEALHRQCLDIREMLLMCRSRKT